MAKRSRGKLPDAEAKVLVRFRSLCLALPETTETESWGHPPCGKGLWVSLDATGRFSWFLVKTLTERSYRLVALKRMIDALEARTATESTQ